MEGVLSTRCLTPSSQSGTPTASYKMINIADITQRSPQQHHLQHNGSVLTPASASSMLRALLLPIAASSPPPSPSKKSSQPTPLHTASSTPPSPDSVSLEESAAPVLTATTPKQLLEGLADRVDRRLATPNAAAAETSSSQQEKYGGFFGDNRRTSTMSAIGSGPCVPSTATTPIKGNGHKCHPWPSTPTVNNNNTSSIVHRSPLIPRPASSSSTVSMSSKKIAEGSQRVGSAMSLHKRNAHLIAAKVTLPSTGDTTTSASPSPATVETEQKNTPPTTPPLAYQPLFSFASATPKGGCRGFSGGMYLRSLDRLNTAPTSAASAHNASGVSATRDEAAPITPPLKALTSLRPTTSSVSKKVPISILNARKWRAERGWNEQDELDRLREERAQTAQAKREFDAEVEPVSRRAIHTPAGGARRMYGAASLYSYTVGEEDDINDEDRSYPSGVDPTSTSPTNHTPSNTSSAILSELNNHANITTNNSSTINTHDTSRMMSMPSYLGDPLYTNGCSELAFDHVEWTPFLDRCSLVAEEVVKRKKNVEWRRRKDAQTAAMQHMAIKESTSFWKRNPNPAEEIRRFKIQVGNGSGSAPPTKLANKATDAVISPPKAVKNVTKMSVSQNGNRKRLDILGSTTFQLSTSPTSTNNHQKTAESQQQPHQDDFYLTTAKVSSTDLHIQQQPQCHNCVDGFEGIGVHKGSALLSSKQEVSGMKKKENSVRGAFITEITKNPSGLSTEDAVKLEAYMRWSPMGSKGQHQFFNSRKARPPQQQKK